jgi:hypothetical protein
MPVPIRYHFTQRFSIPALKAYRWCTDFDPVDQERMGEKGATRQIARLTEGTVILTDTFPIGSKHVKKQKLVQLFPEKLMWTSTHLTGPHKYSQFLYEISAETEKTSRLDFTALHLEYKENLNAEAVRLLEEKLCKEDSHCWVLLAEAMAKELASKVK